MKSIKIVKIALSIVWLLMVIVTDSNGAYKNAAKDISPEWLRVVLSIMSGYGMLVLTRLALKEIESK